ncbi:MAG: leucyl aminopeptidase family protein [Candidatus Izemoplasmataceae bacterium]
MIQKQKRLELTQESKTLIIGDNLENPWVKAVDESLNGEIKALEQSPFTLIHTLGNLKTEKIYVVNSEYLENTEKAEKAFRFLNGMEGKALILTESFNKDDVSLVFETIERVLYDFDAFKSQKASKVELYYLLDPANDDAVRKGIILGEAINEVRTLINTPYNHLNAETLADKVGEWAKEAGIEATILDKKAIEKLKMGAFLGVNAGSKDAPRLIHLTYQGDPSSDERVGLVGKGVMYDTGGYSLKTPKTMPTMKMDMGGAATVLGVFKALHALKAKVNVSVVIAATDNRIGPDAIVPDDILTTASGKTVEIISTDAEGRLTLADALWYAQKKGATRLIDVATLTGSVVASLGNTITGAFTNDQAYYRTLEKTAHESKENVWQLPIMEAHRKALESYSADMANKGGRAAGASVAAAFLERFVNEGVPWIHLDIAGTAFDDKKGATGAMVRTLVNMHA